MANKLSVGIWATGGGLGGTSLTLLRQVCALVNCLSIHQLTKRLLCVEEIQEATRALIEMSSPPSSPGVNFSSPATVEEMYQQVESYGWAGDQEFQSGLKAILGPTNADVDPLQIEDLTLRARCFYYARKSGRELDFSQYKAWRQQQPQQTLTPLVLPSSDGSLGADTGVAGEVKAKDGDKDSTQNQPDQAGQGQYPSKFAQIVELIQSGKPVPGIKEIPDTVLHGQGTSSSAKQRRKPWETAASQEEQQTVQPQEALQ